MRGSDRLRYAVRGDVKPSDGCLGLGYIGQICWRWDQGMQSVCVWPEIVGIKGDEFCIGRTGCHSSRLDAGFAKVDFTVCTDLGKRTNCTSAEACFEGNCAKYSRCDNF